MDSVWQAARMGRPDEAGHFSSGGALARRGWAARGRAAVAAGAVCLMAGGAAGAASPDWPQKPVSVVVAFSAGGTTDILAREIGASLTQRWKQSVVVENKPGASGNIGTQAVVNAAPDGYTLLINSIGPIAVNPSLYRKLPFDPQKDLKPVVLVADVPNVLVVHPSSKVKTLPELVKLMKDKPNSFNCASTGVGTAAHLSCATFAQQAGVQVTHIPYKGADALNDLLGGRVQFMFATIPSVMGHIRSGALVPIAVSTQRRSPSLPNVPTVAESGYPEFALGSWFGYFAPKGTPDEVIARINADVNEVLARPEIKQKLQNEGAEAMGGTPQQFAEYVRTETDKWGKVVQQLGVALD
ncbi:Bug family tripartite tricarboxylate transporter substrate binding protein [Bordetella genomosp. 1]|nr:tripartite tricarboxylate transporter substrate binding protein [Bordetella genomosp. 1]MDQ8035041.1 tripartite tricarboxylate transporter substrate binding protein [Bordetella sp.]